MRVSVRWRGCFIYNGSWTRCIGCGARRYRCTHLTIVAGVARYRGTCTCGVYGLHLQRSGDGRGEFKHDERFSTGTRRDGLRT